MDARRSWWYQHPVLRLSSSSLCSLLVFAMPALSACAGASKGRAAPPRDKVCAHLVELAGQSGATPGVSEQVGLDCETSLEHLELRYANLSSCLVDAGTLEEVAACEQPAARYEPLLRAMISPQEELCLHVLDLIRQGAGGEVIEGGMGECLAELDEVAAEFGPVVYNELVQCVGAAGDLEAFDRCQGMLYRGPADPERAICEHVMNVLEHEFSAAEEELPPDAARQEAVAECMEGVVEERRALGEQGFAELVRCTLEAPNMEAIIRCNEGASGGR